MFSIQATSAILSFDANAHKLRLQFLETGSATVRKP
jgi:hypothetical protein